TPSAPSVHHDTRVHSSIHAPKIAPTRINTAPGTTGTTVPTTPTAINAITTIHSAAVNSASPSISPPSVVSDCTSSKRIPVRSSTHAGACAASLVGENMSETHTLKVADGRTVGYADFGPSNGAAVLWCHGGPGSRMEAAALAPIAASAGFR